MIINAHPGFIGRIQDFIYCKITVPLSRKWFSKKKEVYECTVCGLMAAPYFDDGTSPLSMTYDYGWYKCHSGDFSDRWLCHRCADHEYIHTAKTDGVPLGAREYTFDEWLDEVKDINDAISQRIKTKDPTFYKARVTEWHWLTDDGGRYGFKLGDIVRFKDACVYEKQLRIDEMVRIDNDIYLEFDECDTCRHGLPRGDIHERTRRYITDLYLADRFYLVESATPDEDYDE